MKFISSHYKSLEHKLVKFCQINALNFLRKSFGIIFMWYGILKFYDLSPVESLVNQSTDWLKFQNFFPFLGLWEFLIGFCLFFKKLNRIGLVLFFLQIPGTFLPCFQTPNLCFVAPPFILTLAGQYIFKNFILIASALILVGDLKKR